MLDRIEGGQSATVSPEPSKTCARCKETLPESSFHRLGKERGRRATCADCRNEVRRPHKETPEHRLARKLRNEYQLTIAQYMAIAEAQRGVCAICEKPPATGTRLYVDHCHATGVVRALLCNNCNLNVGVYEAQHRAFEAYLAAYGDGNPLLKN